MNPRGARRRQAEMAITSSGTLVAIATACALAAATLGPSNAGAQLSNAPRGDSLDALLRAAEAHHYRGRFADAHAALGLAESIAAQQQSPPAGLARVWTARANVWVSQTTASNSGYVEADSAAARALEFAERSEEPRLLADAADLAGRVLYSRRINLDEGDYDRPLSYFKRALELRRDAGDTRGVVESMFRVGLIHERKDESARAIAIYEEAMRLAGSEYPLERSNLARHLAYQHQGRGDLRRALELFTESLDLREEAGFMLTRPSALTSIADLYRRKRDYRKALDYARRALADSERLGASRFIVGALISIGQTHSEAGERDPAMEHLTRAESLADEIGYVSGVRQARERLASLAPSTPPKGR
jgi:tetratricopeptide (TPR) repeat protein